jgi:hypothetical protein
VGQVRHLVVGLDDAPGSRRSRGPVTVGTGVDRLRAESSLSCGVGLKRIRSASAPRIAAQLFVATTAAPPGRATTSSTSFIEVAESRSNPSSSAPNTSDRRAQAYTMPGRSTSEANTGSPRTLAGRSTRGTLRPV